MKLENSIQIDAPCDVVWAATVDIERWPEWTPTVDSVQRLDEGELVVGSAALLNQPGLPEAKWVVSAITAGERFVWESHVRGIRMRATHALRAAGAGTENLLRIEMSGLSVWLMWPLMRFFVGRSLAKENAGLKAHCESSQAP